jgi:hypothetical protein
MHFQLMNPAWPDAQPYDTIILAGIATLVIWFNRQKMFTKTTAHAEILPLKASFADTEAVPGGVLAVHTFDEFQNFKQKRQ